MIDEESRDGVRILRLAHGKVNAMDTELLEAIASRFAGLTESGREPLVLTGNGRAFSAGVDLYRVTSEGRTYLERFLPALSRAFRAVFEFPRPVVAAIDGHAIAGGCVLACACDHRIMATTDARIGVPELYVGVPFPTAALEVLRHAVPPPHLEEIVYSGQTYSAEDARAQGLVHEVAAKDDVLLHAIDRARRYGAVRPETYALTKRDLRAPAVARYRPSELSGDTDVDALWLDEATVPVIESYLERTLGAKRRSK